MLASPTVSIDECFRLERKSLNVSAIARKTGSSFHPLSKVSYVRSLFSCFFFKGKGSLVQMRNEMPGLRPHSTPPLGRLVNQGLLDVFTKAICLNISINRLKHRFVY